MRIYDTLVPIPRYCIRAIAIAVVVARRRWVYSKAGGFYTLPAAFSGINDDASTWRLTDH